MQMQVDKSDLFKKQNKKIKRTIPNLTAKTMQNYCLAFILWHVTTEKWCVKHCYIG